MIKKFIQPYLDSAVKELYPEAAGLLPIPLEYPDNPQFGDLSSPIAMHLARPLGQPPRQVASQIIKKLNYDQLGPLVEKVNIDGPGFINFHIKPSLLLEKSYDFADSWSVHPDNPGANQTVMVEFSSPNIAKPFNVGHLRSTIIGDSLARMYVFLGYEVLRDNHLGDWGTQYGKLAYAVEQWGDWSKIEANPIPELFQLYVRINDETKENPELQEAARLYFKRLEEGDPHVRELWQKLSDLSMADFDQLYQQFNIHFDVVLGESFYEPYLKEVIQDCIDAGLAQESQGALVIFPPGSKPQDPPVIIRKSNGTSTYDTRDLAGIRYRFQHFHLDKLIIEIGNEQQFYFQRIIAIAEAMGWTKPGQVVHVGHGLFLGNSGKRLATRTGETVWLRELVDELEQKAAQIVKEKSPNLPMEQYRQIAQKVAIGALKYNDLSQNRLSNITFDKDKALSLDGNSAPYLQYSVARGRSIIAKAESQQLVVDPQKLKKESQGRQEEPTASELSLSRWLNRYNEVVVQAANEYLPSLVASYLFILAQRFSIFYQADPVLTASPEVRSSRLLLVLATRNVLTSGLELLGIQVPPRM